MGLQDVLFTIAGFIEPDMACFCGLSAVNYDFRAVFTSDQVWKSLDVYGVQTGIFESFKRALDHKESQGLLKLLKTRGNSSIKPRVLLKLTANRFVWLQYLVNRGPIEPFLKVDDLMNCVLQLLLYRADVHYPTASRIIGRISDRYKALEVVTKRGTMLEHLPKHLRADYDIVLAAVRSTGLKDTLIVIQHAAYTLQQDPVIGASALKTDARSICYVSQDLVRELSTDSERVLELVKEHSRVLAFISEFCSMDFMLEVLEALDPSTGTHEYLLHRFPSKFTENFDICARAVELDPSNLLYCKCIDKRLITQYLEMIEERACSKDNTRTTATFVITKYLALIARQDADCPGKREILEDHELCKRILEARPESYRYFPDSIRESFEIADRLCADPHNISLLADSLKYNVDFVVQIIENYGDKWQNTATTWTWKQLPLLANKRVCEAVVATGLATKAETDKLLEFPGVEMNVELKKNTGVINNIHSEAYPGPTLHENLSGTEKIEYLKQSSCNSYVSRTESDRKEMVTAMFTPAPYGPICFPYDCVAPELVQDTDFMFSLFELCGLAPSGSTLDCELVLLNKIAYDESFYREASSKQKTSLEFNVLAAKKNANALAIMDQDMRIDPRVVETAGLERMLPSCDICELKNPTVEFTRSVFSRTLDDSEEDDSDEDDGEE